MVKFWFYVVVRTSNMKNMWAWERKMWRRKNPRSKERERDGEKKRDHYRICHRQRHLSLSLSFSLSLSLSPFQAVTDWQWNSAICTYHLYLLQHLGWCYNYIYLLSKMPPLSNKKIPSKLFLTCYCTMKEEEEEETGKFFWHFSFCKRGRRNQRKKRERGRKKA